MHDDYDENEGPSKSELKRQMHALQEIGERLVALSDNQLAKIPIESTSLSEAIQLARKIRSHSGRKRQLQYIGKLMRSTDPEPITAALAALDGQHQAEAARFHQLEQWRDLLLSEGDNAISELVVHFPTMDRSHLRQLLRNYQRDLTKGREKTSARAIFRYLRELEEQQKNGQETGLNH